MNNEGITSHKHNQLHPEHLKGVPAEVFISGSTSEMPRKAFFKCQNNHLYSYSFLPI